MPAVPGEPLESTNAPHVPPAGTVVGGKYRVEGVLGKGGMGVVLAARHEALGQEVAIKILLPGAADKKEAVARFLREARAAAALKSEHVARVSDVGTHDTGVPYMVMERLAGSDLAHVLSERGTIPPAEAIDYVLQACDAIMEAHALGIVHRDLKPSNLFLTRRPNGTPFVKVLDFGISKIDPGVLAAAGREKLTATGVVMGSPLYASPEQVRGSRTVDGRTDIWSLGVVLHELVSGRHPFEAESVSGILAAIAADPPTPLCRHQPDAPPELEAVVLRCLEKGLGRRTPDIATLVGELRPLIGLGGGSDALSRGADAPRANSPEPASAVLVTRPSSKSALSTNGPDPLNATQPAWATSMTRRRTRWTAIGVLGAAVVAAGAVAVAKSGVLGNGVAAPTLGASATPTLPETAKPAAQPARDALSTLGATTGQVRRPPEPPSRPATGASAEPIVSVEAPAPLAVTASGSRPPAPLARSTSPRVEAPPPPKPRDPLSDR